MANRECLPGQVSTPTRVPVDGSGGLPIPLPVVIIPQPKPVTGPPTLLYKASEFDLGTARTDYEFSVLADYLMLWTNGDSTDIRLRLNDKNADILYMSRINPIPGPVTKVYLTNSIQTGKKLAFMLLLNPAVGFPMAAPSTQSVTSISKATFSRLRSDRTVNFTGALATNAIGTENIAGLSATKIVIRRISIQSKQQLNYALLLWARSTFQVTTDINNDTFLAEVGFDLPVIGRRIAAANQYYADLEVNVQYQDDDGLRQLHIGLLNLDATAKNAGATGEVIVEIFYEEAN